MVRYLHHHYLMNFIFLLFQEKNSLLRDLKRLQTHYNTFEPALDVCIFVTDFNHFNLSFFSFELSLHCSATIYISEYLCDHMHKHFKLSNHCCCLLAIFMKGFEKEM